ncbi:MAG: YmdB family metallophosphoesterase, partial [bacterium]|nr:YmdB family metallophosphoesterase [bacterium]
MKVLCIGDVYGEPGRKALQHFLPRLIEQHMIDFVLVNVDNAAGGKGI